ncbi:MAG: hypothetical protein COA78_25470 [Blastopirellula sp.]|nr:MAG: hypothetical protein COA78_25470 [Blastopirellula sp.]
MDIQQFRENYISRIEECLSRLNRPTRLERLQTYYFTWSLPQHPSDDNLYQFMLKLIEIREMSQRQVIEHLHSSCESGTPYSTEDLKPIFGISVDSESDKKILEHLKMHYLILDEIRTELVSIRG